MHRTPGLLTTSTNRNLFQPTKDNKKRRRSEIRQSIQKGKARSTSRSEGSSQELPPGSVEAKLRQGRDASTASGKSNRSQVVDLVVEDTVAEEAQRVRARKEGGDVWNRSEQKHFVRTYSIDDDAHEGQQIREGFEPSEVNVASSPPEHAVSEEEDEDDNNKGEGSTSDGPGRYGSLVEEDNVWDRS